MNDEIKSTLRELSKILEIESILDEDSKEDLYVILDTCRKKLLIYEEVFNLLEKEHLAFCRMLLSTNHDRINPKIICSHFLRDAINKLIVENLEDSFKKGKEKIKNLEESPF